MAESPLKARGATALAVLMLGLSSCQAINQSLGSNRAIPSPFQESPFCKEETFSAGELFKDLSKGVIVVSTNESIGSGFVFAHKDNKTFVMTNKHVVEYLPSNIKFPDGKEFPSKTIKLGDQLDLAILVAEGTLGQVLQIKKGAPNVGTDVVAIGSPSGLEFTLSKGIISSLRAEDRLLQTDTAINEGNSGGPLIDDTGCVVGVNTFGLKGKEGLNFALSNKLISGFIPKEFEYEKAGLTAWSWNISEDCDKARQELLSDAYRLEKTGENGKVIRTYADGGQDRLFYRSGGDFYRGYSWQQIFNNLNQLPILNEKTRYKWETSCEILPKFSTTLMCSQENVKANPYSPQEEAWLEKMYEFKKYCDPYSA